MSLRNPRGFLGTRRNAAYCTHTCIHILCDIYALVCVYMYTLSLRLDRRRRRQWKRTRYVFVHTRPRARGVPGGCRCQRKAAPSERMAQQISRIMRGCALYRESPKGTLLRGRPATHMCRLCRRRRRAVRLPMSDTDVLCRLVDRVTGRGGNG